MYYRNIYQFLFYLVLISGCATTYSPPGWLPSTHETQTEAYGGWMTLSVVPESKESEDYYLQYDGEFISSNKDDIYLLADSLYVIPKNNVNSAILEIDHKNSVAYGLWTAGGCLSTISNGKFLVLTAPLWLLFGVPASSAESYRDRYEYDARTSTDSLYWENIQKFARFPQGISDEINLKTLLPKSVKMSEN